MPVRILRRKGKRNCVGDGGEAGREGQIRGREGGTVEYPQH